jgi:hypothetical protein
MVLLMVLCLLGGLTVACGLEATAEGAEPAVEAFRRRQAAADFEGIYTSAHERFRQAVSRQEFLALMQAVQQSLGAVHTARRVGWNVEYASPTRIVTLNFNTRYASGDATEQFVVEVSDHGALLVGYHIGSPRLRSSDR